MKNALKTLLSAAFLAVSATANALIVFDPTNFSVNNIAAMKTILLDLSSQQQTIHQAKQLLTMYQQLKALNPAKFAEDANQAAADLATAKAYQFATENVSKALGDQGDFITSLQRNYVNSGYGGDFQGYVQALAKRAAAGDLKARQLFDLATRTGDAVAAANQRRKVLQEQNANNEGIQQSAQTTNQYLDVLVSQNQNIQLLLSEQVKALAEQKAQKSADDQMAINRATDAAAREKQTLDGFKERWTVKKK